MFDVFPYIFLIFLWVSQPAISLNANSLAEIEYNIQQETQNHKFKIDAITEKKPASTIKASGQTETVKNELSGATLEAFVIDDIQGTAWNNQNTAILYKNAIHQDSIVKTTNMIDGQVLMNDLLIGIEENKLAPKNIKLYPNPANESVNISYSLCEAADIIIQVYNSEGQLVINKEIQNHNKEITTQ